MTLTLNITHQSSTRVAVYWKLPGDIDGDGNVDPDDFCIIARAYSSSVGEPAYKPEADIDCDGDVDSDDLYLFAGNYGKTEP